MKAHLNVSASTRKEIMRLADEYAKKSVEEQKNGFMRRVLKAVYYVMNREYGFGKKRIQKLDAALWELMNTFPDCGEAYSSFFRRLQTRSRCSGQI